jgi:hypothetical protein
MKKFKEFVKNTVLIILVTLFFGFGVPKIVDILEEGGQLLLEAVQLVQDKTVAVISKDAVETNQVSKPKQVTKLKIYIDAEQTDYYHLGSDITKEYICNGRKIKNGDIIPYTKELTFVATITESDSIDDVGSGKVTMYLPPYNQQKTIVVRVDEAGGRKYPDAYAVWDVTFEVEPVYE